MLFNMDSKRVCLTFFFLILLPLVCEGQKFHHSYATPDSDLMRFRDYRKSIDILDGSKLLLHSEPLYEDIVYDQDSDFSAVSIPLNSIDTLNRRRPFHCIWLCIDYELNPVFVFPLNTVDVKIDPGLQLFLFTDKVSLGSRHWYREGAISFDGAILFEPRYQIIWQNGTLLWGVSVPEESSDHVLQRAIKVVDLADSSNGLIVMLKDVIQTMDLTATPQYLQFKQAWDSILQENPNFPKATQLFKRSAKGPDKKLRAISRFNVKSLNKIKKHY